MKHALSKQNRINRIATRTQKTLLPLVAVGGSLAAAPAGALELGDATVQSRLGQPLRASIAYALAPNEQLAESCVSLGAGHAASGLPGIGRATLSIADGVILLTGKTPVREPMVAANVVVDCPYTANLSREYMLFVDPVGPAFGEQTAPQTAPAAVMPAATAAAPATVAATRRPTAASHEPIGQSSRYRVQGGDTLGDIVKRIENRSMSLWPAVNAIFDANPDAFMDNDPNKLKAGSWLTIPSFDGTQPVVTASAPIDEAETEYPASTSAATSVTEAAEFEMNSTAAAPFELADAPAPSETVNDVSDATIDLRPGDIILDGDNLYVDTDVVENESIVIPDTELQGPTTSSSSPNVPTAVINTTTTETSSSLLMWLVGAGLAIIIGLLLFARLFRNRFGDSPIALDADQPMRRASDGNTEEIESIAPLACDLEDDSPTEENLALDADLIIGTGLSDGTDMDVAPDFGFASPTDVDIELPFEPQPTIAPEHTDVIPAARTDDHTILVSEVLPVDDDYDMSVIVDATKMPQAEDVTERDLQAVEVSALDDSVTTDNYTINKEVDFNILEQDYEDELTATQALNIEISRVAAELAGNMDDDSTNNGTGDDITAEMPLATVTELDVTAQLPRRDKEISDLDDTGVNEVVTVNMAAEDRTAEMPVADNDDTTEMEVEGGKIDTKAV